MHINLENEPLRLLNYTNFVKNTCAVLFKEIGINHFSYIEADETGNFFWLDSHDEYLRQCILQGIIKNKPLNILKSYPKKGFYLLDTYSQKDQEYCKDTYKLLQDFNFGHSFRVLEILNSKDKVLKFYCFDASLDNPDINHIYLNNLDTLSKFNNYFDSQLAPLRPLLPKLSISNHLEFMQRMSTAFIKESISLAIPFNKKSFPHNTHLTLREKEVLWWHIRGKTSDETASLLGISRRTVERHFENLREKYDCKSKNQLILKLASGY
ncbi:helix-turn-helix transcriptional regulator [Legionella gresilensis]|uniref:helix-turn-helix transcriptional regulator n=1 Tax=Legionella gresilensis TaxID=91823 RepID=UPI0010418957|nr:helix-turn-helix transcriptional regulator [Legionella gresilensis]